MEHQLIGISPEGEVIYDEWRWKIFSVKRGRAKSLLEHLASNGIVGFIYGSVARGDVREKSDVDVIVLNPPTPLSLIDEVLSQFEQPVRREIVQATPRSTPKYYIHLSRETVVSLPVGRLGERESDFYKFGGMLDLEGILKGKRVPGVNKELRLIYPTEKGHIEYPVPGNEELVAKVLGVSKGIVEERVRVLTKRRTVGTTGLYVNYTLQLDECVEDAIRRIAYIKKGFRERVRDLIS